MRGLRRLAAVAMASLLAVGLMGASPAGAITLPEKQALLNREVTDVNFYWYMYANRSAEPYVEFDWTTDYCSYSPDKPLGFNFKPACQRHDFNYRNFKATVMFNHDSRLIIDNQLLADMDRICRGYAWWQRPACYGTADTYYGAVRTFGGP